MTHSLDPRMYIVVVTVVLLLPIVIIVRVSVAGALDDDFALTAFPSETYYIRTYIVYNTAGTTSTHLAAFVWFLSKNTQYAKA